MTGAYAPELEALIDYHIVEGSLQAEPLTGGNEYLTLDGTHDQQLYIVPVTLELLEKEGALIADSARSAQPYIVIRESMGDGGSELTGTMSAKQQDRLFIFPGRVFKADDGVIHVIDAVLVPKESRYQIKWERKENRLGEQSGG